MATGRARRTTGASSVIALAAAGLLLAGMTGKNADATGDADAGGAAGADAASADAASATRAVNAGSSGGRSAGGRSSGDDSTGDGSADDRSSGDGSAGARSSGDGLAGARSSGGPDALTPTQQAALAAFDAATFNLADAAVAATLIDPAEAATLADTTAHSTASATDVADAFAAAFDGIFHHERSAEQIMKTLHDLGAVELGDWQAHLIDLLTAEQLCERTHPPAHELPAVADAPRLPSCAAVFGSWLAALDPSYGGAMELDVVRRAVLLPVSPTGLLVAAFELGLWRPADLHPQVAKSYRWVAAGVRRAGAPPALLAFELAGVTPSAATAGRTTCGVTALALAGEMAHRYPRITKVWRGVATNDELDLAVAAAARVVAEELCRSAPSRWDITPAGVQALTWSTDLPYRACDPFADTPATEDDLVEAGGTLVHRCLAVTANALVAAAAADGIELNTSGWRSLYAQLWLRQRNCPLPPADDPGYQRALWNLPQDACSPPTAPPRKSRHQSGVAIDFTCGPDATSLTRQDSPCTAWLEANAHRFGFYNLPSEPWHWSTDGL